MHAPANPSSNSILNNRLSYDSLAMCPQSRQEQAGDNAAEYIACEMPAPAHHYVCARPEIVCALAVSPAAGLISVG